MAAFQRRHYVLIADTLAKLVDATPQTDLFARADLSLLVDRFVALFERDNDRFKPSTFRARVWRDGTE